MKHFMQTALLLLLFLILAGCGSGGNSVRQADNGNTVETAINEQMAAADGEANGTETAASDVDEGAPETAVQMDGPAAAQAQASAGTGTVDYDLTGMNSDMVYATVYQMMMNPDSYIGKTVKMTGPFYPYTNENGTVYYPACIIEDAMACCAQGMEFVLKGAAYPDGYPEEGAVITVIGRFETYQEEGSLYCHLVDGQLTAVSEER